MIFTFGDALQKANQILSTRIDLVEKNLVNVEAEQLVVAAFRKSGGSFLSRLDLYSRKNEAFPTEAEGHLIQFCEERVLGKTLQHLTGVQFFLNHEYQVGPEVLVPRPETEVLVVSAIAELSSKLVRPHLGLEVGLGSGVISIELLHHFPSLKMIASELSPGARDRAKKNADLILGGRSSERLRIVTPEKSLDVLEPFQAYINHQKADFIISNPPYLIGQDEIDLEVVRNEPSEALYAPSEDALYFYRLIEKQARHYICSGGLFFAELPHERALEIQNLFEDRSWDSRLVCDLTDRKRVLIARLTV